MVGFELIDRGIPRNGYQINDSNGKSIGFVTSGTMGPSVKKAIGLGYVDVEFANEWLQERDEYLSKKFNSNT